MQEQVYNRRWYDRQPAVRLVVDQLQKMPAPVMEELLSSIMAYMARDAYLNRILRNSERKLSRLKAYCIRQSDHNFRWYDQNPLSKKLMHYLYILEPEQRNQLAERLGGLFSLVELYLTMCSQHDQPYQQTDIATMMNDYLINEKPEEVKKFLAALRQTLKQQFGFAPLEDNQATPTLEQLMDKRIIQESAGSMKIRE